jgi:hypothetical protein
MPKIRTGRSSGPSGDRVPVSSRSSKTSSGQSRPSSADNQLLRCWEQAHDYDSRRDGIVEMENFALHFKIPLQKCLELLDEALGDNLVGFANRWFVLINRFREG